MRMKIYLTAFLAMFLCSNQALARCGPKQSNRSFDHHKEKKFCPKDWHFRLDNLSLNVARDSLPQKANVKNGRIDHYAFPFHPLNSKYDAAVDMVVHLPAVGSLGKYTIYKVADGLGVILSGGGPSMIDDNPIRFPTGQRKKVAPRGAPYFNSADSMGTSLKMTPVLLSPLSKITMTEKKKVVTFYIRDRQGQFWGRTHFDVYLDSVTLNSTLRTCRLTSSRDVTLKFPTVSKTSFPNVGSLVYGATTDISLKCERDIEVWATLSDVNNTANRSDTLSIESGVGKARNVGIKLFKNNEHTPLSYGQQSPVKRNQNSWRFSNRGEINPSVKLTGYYVRTGDISPGEVNAQAVITFSYQ